MSDSYLDSDSGESVPDPWLHFTITPESVAAKALDLERDPPSQSEEGFAANWPSDPAAASSPNPASLLAEDFFRRRTRGDTASFSGGTAPHGAAADSLQGLVSCGIPGVSHGGTNPNPSHGRFLRLPEVGDNLFGFHLRY